MIGQELGIRFEAFPEGPDDGMDGRHAAAEGDVILQARHYHSSGYSKLKSKIKRVRPSIEGLKGKTVTVYICRRAGWLSICL